MTYKKKKKPKEELTTTDIRPVSLRVDLEDVTVHEINTVQYETSSHSVYRSRYDEIPFKKIEDF